MFKWFQSPCAGNMFGKPRRGHLGLGKPEWPSYRFNPRVRGTCLVSSLPSTVMLQYADQSGFNPRVRGTCLVSEKMRSKVPAPSGFQSPCAGNMFGKNTDLKESEVVVYSERAFQSPCAGNMFGKGSEYFLTAEERKRIMFQSPCAGNMFGKTKVCTSTNHTRIQNRFQSPCAGNMFGKENPGSIRSFVQEGRFNPRVRGTCLVSG